MDYFHTRNFWLPFSGRVIINSKATCWIIFFLALLLIFTVWLMPSVRAESYARVCTTTVDAESNENAARRNLCAGSSDAET
jgi:hypothetical protein